MATHPLHHFETFLSVAQSGSFTAAARKLGISKAAVSHTIRLLEESLQTPLFIRTTRNIRLTEEGELLFIQCEKLKNELDLARDLISGFSSSPSGNLKISCNPYFAETRLVKILTNYMERFPLVTIEILSEERMPDMDREQIDIVFGINWSAPPEVVAKAIGKTRYVLCASPKYIEQFGIPGTIKELEKHRYIPHLGRSSENIVADLKQKTPLQITPTLKLNSAHFMKICALNHLGIVQLHDYMVEEELKKGQLVEVLQSSLKPAIPLFIYYQKHRFVQPKIKHFINLVVENIAVNFGEIE